MQIAKVEKSGYNDIGVFRRRYDGMTYRRLVVLYLERK